MTHPSRSLRSLVALALHVAALLSFTSFARTAGAEPWFGFSEGRLEDRYTDGEIDAEDLVGMHSGRSHAAASDLRSRSWLSVKGFYADRANGTREFGAIAVLGLAFDKIAAGPVHRTRDALHNFAEGPSPRTAPAPAPAPAPSAPAPPPAPPAPRLAVTPQVARSCVAAAWRASGLGVDDARLDAMIARSRLSASLPEMRLRIMRLVNDSAKTDTVALTDQQRYYDATGANLWLEARLTWRLDRLLYADDEPTLERVRIERHDARTRLSARVLDVLLAWQRAWLDRAGSAEGSRDHLEASLRMTETETTLDVLTAGWFSTWRTTQSGLGPP